MTELSSNPDSTKHVDDARQRSTEGEEQADIAPTPPRPPTIGSFTEGPVHRHIVKLSAYMSLGFLSWVLASMMEAIYLGVLGTPALAALGFSMPVTMVMMSVANGLGIGASSVIARRLGAGDRESVRRLCSHSILLGLAIVIVFAALGITFSSRLFALLGATPDIRVLIDDYMLIWFLGIPFFATSTVNTNLLRATGNASVPGIVMALGSVIQMILSPFLIFGLLGFPELGIKGAAIAFVVGAVVSLSITMYWLVIRERLIGWSLTGIWTSWRDILHVGLPSMATSLVSPVASGIITRLLAGHGAAVVAGFSIAMRADMFIMMVLMASASALGPFVGMNWGAAKYEGVLASLRMVNGFCVVWGTGCFLLMFFFAEPIVLLINQDPEVVRAATHYLLIVPISIGFMGLMSVASSTFNALGKPLPSMILSMARMAVLYVPLALLADWLYGYVGIFIATSFTSIIVGIWAYFWLRRVIRREIRIKTSGSELQANSG
jgi:putative MATE family efflux protein